MSKFRSKTNYKEIYDGENQGYNLGIDGAIFLKAETSPRTFAAPSIGTQGSSISDAAPSEDVSASGNTNLQVAVDGGAAVAVTLVTAGLTTGALIAAELEDKINAALLADGQDSRVWVEFAASLYTIYSQATGVASSVVITAGASLDIAAELKLGVANSGVEAAGTDDDDFLLYTTGGPVFSQPIESSSHRSGRFHSSIIRSKKMVEWNVSTYVNMSGDAGDSLDTAVKLLWKGLLGTEEVVASTRIRYTQGNPNTFFSMVRVSTIFGEYFTGGYVKDMNMTFPGDGPATCEWSGKAADRKIAGLAQVDGAVVASATVVLNAGQAKRYDAGARVMGVLTDGRTIVAGADGSLLIDSLVLATDTLTLSAAVDLPDDAYIVPWNPGAVNQTARDAIFTDLEGTYKFSQSVSAVCVTNIGLNFVNNHTDKDNCFGFDTNAGYIQGGRLDMTLSVTYDLNSVENMAETVQSSAFAGFDPEVILGSPASGRYMRIRAPKWVPPVPALEVPDEGPTPITMEGLLLESAPGAKDPIQVDFL